ncbi:MAG: double-strand break repair helicase AddA [Alphaproteobacteria bacterium]|nr:double-strand break repair helicase AddA [Alphaproteobacteria bacterium]
MQVTDTNSPRHRAHLDQRKAADTLASVWVGASAGTGKTKVLTDRVLALLLDGTLPQRILCLTFTRAAAAEMANRVRGELGKWAIAADDALAASIRKLNGAAADERLLAHARGLFGEVLNCPGGLKIQTIHAFCESLLRRFPVEAGLQPHFQLMDERTARELLGAAREEVLARAMNAAEAASDRTMNAASGGPENALAGALSEISARVSGDDFHKLMGRLADDRGRLTRLLARLGGLEGTAQALAGRFGINPDEDEEVLIRAASSDAAFDGPGLAIALTVMENGQKTDQDRARAMAPFLAAPADQRPGLINQYRKGLLTRAGAPFAQPITKGALKKADDPEAMVEVLEAEAARLITLEGRLRDCRAYRASVAALTLGAALVAAYDAHKHARALLDYEDLILKTRGLLEGSDAAQWVLFKLDGGIDHVLVDEAQDTSPDQWGVIQALTEEFFAGAGAREDQRTVFAVGDSKQSIYSFQRADPRAFGDMRGYFQTRVKQAAARWLDVDLSISFRSTAAVLDAVDAVFAKPPARDGIGAAASDIRHRPAREGEAGVVELWPILASAKPAAADPWAPGSGGEAGISAPERLAMVIAATIYQWITDGEMLVARNRPIRAGDIMVLVRRRTAFVAHLVRALKRLKVPVAGADRMILTDELAVMDLIALGRFALLPEDDLNLACVLKGPFLGLSEEQLFDLAHGRRATLWAALRGRAREGGIYGATRDWLGALLARADVDRPYEFFASILNHGQGREKLVTRLGREAEDPVNEFLELALAYERSAAPSLEGFLAWIRAGQAEIKRDLEQAVRDEVRVMTVHGAKGLQAPIVFLPDTTQNPRPSDLPYWAPPVDNGGPELPLWAPKVADFGPLLAQLRKDSITAQEHESHRLLYVAMTRAEDRLYVCGWQGYRKLPDGCWYNLVKSGLEEAPGVVESEQDFSAIVPGFSGPALNLNCPQMLGVESKPAPEKMPLPDLETSWADRPPEPEPVHARPLAPSDPGEAPPAMAPGTGGSDRFQRGRLVHTLLQHLPKLDPASRGDAARAYLARPAFGLSSADRETIAAETLGLLSDPAFASLFAPGSLAEVPVTGTIGDHVVAGQIDRLVVTADTVLVADYKTGQACPDDIGGVPPAYMRQMALYRALIARALPGRAVHCALVFTSRPRLIALPDDVLDGALQDLGG